MNLELLRLEGERNPVAALVYHPKRPRNVSIVAGHGYSSSKHNLDFLCNFLASHGFAVYNLDFPGHKLGASGGTLSCVEDLIDAMTTVARHARETAAGPLYYMGHSMGAMTAILTAAQDPGAGGIVAITTGFGRPSGIAILQSKGAVDFRSAYVNGVTLPELVGQIDDERFGQALASLAGKPQLYIAADRDAMVSVRSVEILYARASEPKTFAGISSDHTFAADNARGEVLAWLTRLHPR